MLDVVLPILSEKIEAQAVTRKIDLVKKAPPEFDPLGSVDKAFEYRVLNTLTIIFTTRRYPAETSASFDRFRIYIIGYDDESQGSPREEGWVRAYVLSYRPGQQDRLHKWEKPDCELLAEEWV